MWASRGWSSARRLSTKLLGDRGAALSSHPSISCQHVQTLSSLSRCVLPQRRQLHPEQQQPVLCKRRHFSSSQNDHLKHEPLDVTNNEDEVNKDVIDIDKELLRYDYEEFTEDFVPESDAELTTSQPIISLERGTSGVFDVEELVAVLRDENAKDLCVIKVPQQLRYVDFLVILTGRSTRHLIAMAEQIKWLFKKKRGRRDPQTVKIEGEKCKDWIALDLGNIAVHLFLQRTRERYDLETLWTVGARYDEKVVEGEDAPMDDFFFGDAMLGSPSAASASAASWLSDDSQSLPSQPETYVYRSHEGEEREGMESLAGWHQVQDDPDKSH